MMIERKDKRVIISIIVVAIILIFALINISNLFNLGLKIIDVLKPILFGFCISYVVNLFMTHFEKTLFKNVKKYKRACSMLLAILLITIFIVLFIMFVFPRLFDAFTVLIPKILTAINEIFVFLDRVFKNEKVSVFFSSINLDLNEIENDLMSFSSSILTKISNGLIFSASRVYDFMYSFVLGFVFALYMLASKEKIQSFLLRFLKAVSSDKFYNNTCVIFETANESFSAFIKGQSIECLIIGASIFAAMIIGGFPNALLISFIIMVFDYLPIFGAFIGLFIGYFLIAIYSFSQANIFVVVFLIIQQIEGNVLYPKIVGTSVGLPAILVLASITIMGSLFGFFGLLIAVPFTATLYKLTKKLIEARLEIKTNL